MDGVQIRFLFFRCRCNLLDRPQNCSLSGFNLRYLSLQSAHLFQQLLVDLRRFLVVQRSLRLRLRGLHCIGVACSFCLSVGYQMELSACYVCEGF